LIFFSWSSRFSFWIITSKSIICLTSKNMLAEIYKQRL
jgi:hypothetical protein